ncbi:glycoside hydrolase family 108 protein [Emcibacter sp.]|uniref:glycoside hydrolase family 108 protein n=1 Tax=Emcibacter sp. TaxID=1979954 RepID=UPI002AA92B89|nr:glycosyl hydrolase 108 family protein [Emcibacter sp.]
MEHEGGLVDDPDDPGGITKFGISLRTLVRLGEIDLDQDGHPDYDFNGDGAIDADDIKDLSWEDAQEFYHREFWSKYRYGELPPRIRMRTFNLAVNMGPVQAHKCLQRSIRATSTIRIADDGIIGKQTISFSKTFGDELIVPLRSEAAGFYRALVVQKLELKKYLNGWLNRAYS